MPALVVCTQALGEPRYPSLKGIMAARNKEIAVRSLADLGLDAGYGRWGGGRRRRSSRPESRPAARCDAPSSGAAPKKAPQRSSHCSRPGGSSDGHDLGGRRADADGSLARISAEAATLARTLAEPTRDATPPGVVVAADPGPAATELAGYLPPCRHGYRTRGRRSRLVDDRRRSARRVARRRCSTRSSSSVPDRTARDAAGALSGLTTLPVLVNATAVGWDGDRPVVEMSVFGGKLIDHVPTFAEAGGIITVGPIRHGRSRAEDRCRRGRSADGGPSVPRVATSSGMLPRPAPPRRSRRRGSSCRGPRRGGARPASSSSRRLRRRSAGPLVRLEGGRRRGLDPVRPADRADRQDRSAAALPCARHLRRDPAQGRHADGGDDRRRQPRSRRADRGVRGPVVVGDLFEVVPALLEALRARGG